MKTIYRGFEIDAHREECLAGYDLLYYYIMRQKDQWFLEDSFTTGEDTEQEIIEDLKSMVDDFYDNPEDYEDR